VGAPRVRIGRRRSVGRPRLPAGVADHPRDDVLETAEDGAPIAGRLLGAESVVALDRIPAPGASLRLSHRRTNLSERR
jgi:hypothetical protein